MKAAYDDSGIKNYWTSQAVRHGPAASASWADARAIDLEKRALLPYLQDGARVLDIGCSNGHATLTYAALKDIDILGMDYVPEMIEAARENHRAMARSLRGKAAFEVGDVRSLSLADAVFDTVITTRVIINLQNWEAQRQGIRECLRALRPGGVALLSEATRQGHENLNRLRAELGLPPLKTPDFNLYLDIEQVAAEPWEDVDEVEIVDFSSTYYLMTRALKPILEKLPGALVKAVDPASEVNRLAAMLPAWGDYGVQKLFVLRKRNHGGRHGA